MFLDAWLGLAVAGTIAVVVLVALALTSFFAIAHGFRIRGTKPIRGKIIATIGLISLATIFALSIHALGEHRSEKQVVLDLRKSKSEVLLELAMSCERKITDDACDSTRHKLSAIIIFEDGLQLPVSPSEIHWHKGVDQSFGYISLLGAHNLPLTSGKDILMSNSSFLSTTSSPKIHQDISHAREWLTKAGSSVGYSELLSIELRPGFSMQFRKNKSQVSIDYSITSTN